MGRLAPSFLEPEPVDRLRAVTVDGDQVMTLISVGFGGLVGYLFTSLRERKLLAERRSTKWDQTRFVAYSEFAKSIKACVRTCDRMASHLNLRTQAPALDLAIGWPRLTEEQDHATSMLEQVLLLGEDATREAARAWQLAAHEVSNALLRAKTSSETEEYVAAFKAAGDARDAFYREARRELRVAEHGPGTGKLASR